LTAPRLELRQLSKQFGSFRAVDGVSLTVDRGEFLTLLGASGSGKTTTLRLIAGFEAPTAGAILIDGVDAAHLPPFKRPVNTVFQQYALFPHMSVRDNVGYGLRMRRVAPAEIQERVGRALEMVRLHDLGARAPRQLSGGQQQRVALARALVNEPQVLLLDEPLGALDLKLRRQMQGDLTALNRQLGITFIYVTHDQQEALTMSDRIAVVNEGIIAQVGSPDELYDRPCDRFVASFIGESNFLPGVVRGFEDGLVVAECAGGVVRAVASVSVAIGTRVTLTTRPERMRFADVVAVNGTPQNRLRVTVTDAVFAGERCRYLCQGEGGVPIVLKEASGADTRRRGIGETIEIAWSVADTVVV
jgi:spermidine/putrescine ABC transporter ATP-binding subunit